MTSNHSRHCATYRRSKHLFRNFHAMRCSDMHSCDGILNRQLCHCCVHLYMLLMTACREVGDEAELAFWWRAPVRRQQLMAAVDLG